MHKPIRVDVLHNMTYLMKFRGTDYEQFTPRKTVAPSLFLR